MPSNKRIPPEGPKRQWQKEKVDQFSDQLLQFVQKWMREGKLCDLNGVKSPGGLSIVGASDGAEEVLAISFDGAEFSQHVQIENIKIQENASFQHAQFVNGISLRFTEFAKSASFQHSRFLSEPQDPIKTLLSFQNCNFAGSALFEGIDLHGIGEFHDTTFGGFVSFISAQFRGNAEFRLTKFLDHVSFERSHFLANASFGGATFKRSTSFKGAEFSELASFSSARFEAQRDQEASFEDAGFGGQADFRKALFNCRANFAISDSRVPQASIVRADFDEAIFDSRASFVNRSFKRGASFRKSAFKVAPEFYGCSFHQNTDFSLAVFDDLEGKDGVNAASAYRTLKLAMEALRNRSEEADFFAREQLALLARADTPLHVKLASYLYWITADYGRSFILPLVWIAITLGIFSLIYFGVQTYGERFIQWCDVWDAIRLGLSQIFQPFKAFRTQAQGESIPLWFAVIEAAQSLFTYGLFALFLLALRRRFKLG